MHFLQSLAKIHLRDADWYINSPYIVNKLLRYNYFQYIILTYYPNGVFKEFSTFNMKIDIDIDDIKRFDMIATVFKQHKQFDTLRIVLIVAITKQIY